MVRGSEQMDWVDLVPHPIALPHAPIKIRASAKLKQANHLFAAFELSGAQEDIVWPDRKVGAFIEGLWQSTCLELFLFSEDDASYVEFNFSPSTDWCAYVFQSYRAGRETVPDVSFDRFDTHLGSESRSVIVEVKLPEARLNLLGSTYRVSLTAVIQDISGQMSYWAESHPSAQPDFHICPDGRRYI